MQENTSYLESELNSATLTFYGARTYLMANLAEW